MDQPSIDLTRARIALEVTSYCNLRCAMCPLKTMKRGFVHMDLDLLHKLHREIREMGVKVRWLHEMGEPLIYPHIIEALNLFPEVTLSTHGGLLKESVSEKILTTPLEHIRICLDTVNPEIYPKIRIGGKFDVVVENTRRFLELARGKPIDIQIQRMITRITLKESVKDFERLFNLKDYPNARVIEKTCEALDTTDATELHGVYAGCFQGGPFNWFVVLADGTVTHCCYDYEGHQIIGNAREESIVEIAKSPVLKSIHDAFLNHDFSYLPRCAECFKHQGEVTIYPTWLYRLVRQLPFRDVLRKKMFRRGGS